MTIVEFLLARIAEDEARAQARREAMLNVAERWPTLSEDIRNLIDVRGIDRVLAECQAKRAIVALHKPATLEDLWGAARSDIAKDLVCEYDSSPDGHLGDTLAWPCVTLMYLVAVYADHPDYRQEWKP